MSMPLQSPDGPLYGALVRAFAQSNVGAVARDCQVAHAMGDTFDRDSSDVTCAFVDTDAAINGAVDACERDGGQLLVGEC